ncbi:MAG: TRAP transporter small permease subunit [Betaproteobacteria bacterium]|nr:MAG: TRAP transporter small permease subunit [Betaproteobacteria bacterium]
MLAVWRRRYERLLEWVAIVLMVALALLVAVAVVYRKAGVSIVWYDEIASVLLAWITFYGAALAALRGAHIGVSALVDAMPPPARLAATLLAEACVIGFFGLLAWVGWSVLEVLATDHLVSLPEVSVMYTQSVIPIGSALFVIAELLRLPEALRAAGTPIELSP